jgi:hypothetical protein
MRGFILKLMDIHYSLDGSEFGTTCYFGHQRRRNTLITLYEEHI